MANRLTPSKRRNDAAERIITTEGLAFALAALTGKKSGRDEIASQASHYSRIERGI
jgi:hypothetical protein